MIRFIIAAIFIIAGVIIIASAMVGNFRFGYVLNRMQVGATADTLGTMLVILGLIIISGINTISYDRVFDCGFMHKEPAFKCYNIYDIQLDGLYNLGLFAFTRPCSNRGCRRCRRFQHFVLCNS